MGLEKQDITNTLNILTMKKILIAVLVALTAITANSQSWVGGSLGLDVTSAEGGSTITTITISPEYGFTINDKWDIGVVLEEEVSFVGDYDLNVISLEPYARYTFAEAGIASFFVDGGIGFGCEYTNYKGKEFDNTAWGFSIGFKPGVKLSLTEDFSLVAKLGFLGYKRFEATDSHTNAGTYNSFGFKVDGDALSLGAYWNF